MDVSILRTIQQPSVKLMKMSKGYNWEIKIYGDDMEEILRKVKDTDDKLKELYPIV